MPRLSLPLQRLLPLVLAGVLVVWSLCPSSAQEEPHAFLVLPYLQLPTPDSMTILWETNRKLPGQVDYGLTRELGQKVESNKSLALQEIQLIGLKPGTTYHYRVRSGSLVSDIYSFRSAPPAGTRRWRMALYGDSRSFPEIHRKVAAQIARARVDLIVHTGDIVFNGKNRDNWRKEFFEPLGDLIRSVPWVSTIGNHERNADEYFSYAALPGNRRYFTLDFASARFLCLDSNSWIEKGRDSEQGKWLAEQLLARRDAEWTFAVFHHALFSAHVSRPAEPLRWEWAPLLLDPAHKIDAVLAGHDHFYARNYRMARLAEKPQPGVLFLTTAGGGAPLYRSVQRDYVAREKPDYHFVLMEFDGSKITCTSIDTLGREIDRFVMTKEPTPAEEFCAYEIEELRDFLRRTLASAKPLRLEGDGPTVLDSELSIPTRFKVPVSGQLVWDVPRGWKMKTKEDFQIEPGQPLKIPLKAEVAAGPHPRTPQLRIAFAPGRFRNRVIAVSPFLLTGPAEIAARAVKKAPVVDGQLIEDDWQHLDGQPLLGLPPDGGRDDEVRLRSDKEFLYIGATLSDPANQVQVMPRDKAGVGDRSLLSGENVHVILARGKEVHTFVITPEQQRLHDIRGAQERAVTWATAAARGRSNWQVEMAIPRSLFPDWSDVLVNVCHRRRGADSYQELQLCPMYGFLQHPDHLPDIRPAENMEQLARLKMP